MGLRISASLSFISNACLLIYICENVREYLVIVFSFHWIGIQMSG
jgi:hypothetical protein